MTEKKNYDLLTRDKIKTVLTTQLFGNKIFAFWSIGSTNEFAYTRALQGETEGTLVIAEEQRKGRGRMSRHWDSIFNKGLWFSLILCPNLAASNAGLIPYLGSVSVAEAVENFINLTPDVKWPNDLLFHSRKFCGILSEVEFDHKKVKFIILGIGINVNHRLEDFPEQYRDRATSLRIVTNRKINRLDLLAQVISRLEDNYLHVIKYGFDPILIKWKQRCPQFGKNIVIIQDDVKFEGKFKDLDREGRLMLQMRSGELKRIVAGDIPVKY